MDIFKILFQILPIFPIPTCHQVVDLIEVVGETLSLGKYLHQGYSCLSLHPLLRYLGHVIDEAYGLYPDVPIPHLMLTVSKEFCNAPSDALKTLNMLRLFLEKDLLELPTLLLLLHVFEYKIYFFAHSGHIILKERGGGRYMGTSQTTLF